MKRIDKLRKNAGAKLRAVSGFSLTELLLTVLILLLMTGIVADGMPVVIRLYQRTVDVANAEAYLSTTMIALRSKLSLASKVEVKVDDEDNKLKIIYLDPTDGYCKITNNSDKGIQIEYLQSDERSPRLNPASEPWVIPLLSSVKSASGSDNFISYYNDEPNPLGEQPVKYANGFITITGLSVIKRGSTDTEALASAEPYVIHTPNAKND